MSTPTIDINEPARHAAALVDLIDDVLTAMSIPYSSTELIALDDAAFPYAVVHIGSPRRSSERLAKAPHRLDYYPRVTVVGMSKDQCEQAAAVVGQSLALRRPVVAGRSCSLIEHVGTGEAARDDSAPGGGSIAAPGHEIWAMTESWHFSSTAL